jgi:hypothetical protein
MIKKSIKTFDTKLPDKGAFTIETEEDFPKLNTLSILSGRRGGGKSVALANFLKKCKDKYYFDKIILVSPTYQSNKLIWDICEINEEDVIEPEITSMREVLNIIDQEKMEWDNFVQKKKKYQEFLKDRKTNLERIKAARLLMYYEEGFLEPDFDKPMWKYPKEHPPRIAVVLDDCMGTPLMNKPSSGLTQFAIKHRHVSGGLGCSLFMLVQSYRSRDGVPRAIRENTTNLWLFRVNNEDQIKAIKDECDLPVSDEEFMDMCSYAHNIPYNFLFIDFSPKTDCKRFRSGLNQYLIPPSITCKCDKSNP